MDATALGLKIRNRDISMEEAVLECWGKISELEPKINALITPMPDEALSAAGRKQEKAAESISILDGVPFVSKDNICLTGKRTTCASNMLRNYAPPYTATALEQVLKAGCICMGKSNMDEFAMGATGQTSFFGKTLNPLDYTKVPGGSSSGSAAAVASGECYFALGSDSGGSVRLPAAYCGLVGMLPTYGRVSRYGLIAHVSSMDQIGPITKSVRDCAAVMNLICGHDKKDATSIYMEDSSFHMNLPVNGMKIAISDIFMKDADDSVKKAVYKAAKVLEAKGAIIKDIDLSELFDVSKIYSIIACAEASSNLARYDGIKYGGFEDLHGDTDAVCKETRRLGFGDEVKRRILFGSYVLSDGYEKYYLPAVAARRKIVDKLNELFKDFDGVLLPVARTTAPLIDDDFSSAKEVNATDLFTVVANLAQIPAITVPFGKEGNMPVGIQLMGKRFSENTLLALAGALEG